MSYFAPRCDPPRLVVPVRVGAPDGPTRGAAGRGRWRRTSHGFYLPVSVDRDVVEQRIMEQAVRLGGVGAVAGWAALRMCGAAYFDGTWRGRELPVPLISGRQLSPGGGAATSRRRITPDDVRLVQGVPCLRPELALLEELARLDEVRSRVVATDMALAARVTSLERVREAVERLPARRRAELGPVLDQADEGSLSPAETRMRLVWTLDLGYPQPVSNASVFGPDGAFVGMPDLLDPEAGVVGEYDGSAHRERERHRRDIARLDAFRRVGLECFTVVAGDSRATVMSRMREARDRALRSPAPHAWTWYRRPRE